MSETVTFKGKIKEIEQKENLIETIKYYLSLKGIVPEEDEDDIMDQAFYELDNYVITSDKVYKIVSIADIHYESIFQAKQNEDGTIDYLVQYYNGGCSFDEAIGHALKNM